LHAYFLAATFDPRGMTGNLRQSGRSDAETELFDKTRRRERPELEGNKRFDG